MDSDLAEEIMLACASRGYACLPVHDSFIVHHGYDTEVKELMQEVFVRRFHALGKLKFSREQPNYPNTDVNMDDFLSAGWAQEGFLLREQQWYDKKRKSDNFP